MIAFIKLYVLIIEQIKCCESGLLGTKYTRYSLDHGPMMMLLVVVSFILNFPLVWKLKQGDNNWQETFFLILKIPDILTPICAFCLYQILWVAEIFWYCYWQIGTPDWNLKAQTHSCEYLQALQAHLMNPPGKILCIWCIIFYLWESWVIYLVHDITLVRKLKSG